jgi:hypothetical protein
VDDDRNLVQFPEVVLYQPVIEGHRQLLIDWVDTLDDPGVRFEYLLAVVFLRLDDLVANLESPAEQPDCGLGVSGWVCSRRTWTTELELSRGRRSVERRPPMLNHVKPMKSRTRKRTT